MLDLMEIHVEYNVYHSNVLQFLHISQMGMLLRIPKSEMILINLILFFPVVDVI